MCKAKEIAEKLLNYLTEMELEYNNTCKAAIRADKEVQDLLHDMELTNFNACEGYIMAKKMQEVRRRRRVLKDDIETFKILKENTSHIPKQIKTIVSKIKQKESDFRLRFYRPRVRADLKLVTDKVKKVNQSKQLEKVNQTNIKFHSEVDKIEQLLAQVQ